MPRHPLSYVCIIFVLSQTTFLPPFQDQIKEIRKYLEHASVASANKQLFRVLILALFKYYLYVKHRLCKRFHFEFYIMISLFLGFFIDFFILQLYLLKKVKVIL